MQLNYSSKKPNNNDKNSALNKHKMLNEIVKILPNDIWLKYPTNSGLKSNELLDNQH